MCLTDFPGGNGIIEFRLFLVSLFDFIISEQMREILWNKTCFLL